MSQCPLFFLFLLSFASSPLAPPSSPPAIAHTIMHVLTPSYICPRGCEKERAWEHHVPDCATFFTCRFPCDITLVSVMRLVSLSQNHCKRGDFSIHRSSPFLRTKNATLCKTREITRRPCGDRHLLTFPSRVSPFKIHVTSSLLSTFHHNIHLTPVLVSHTLRPFHSSPVAPAPVSHTWWPFNFSHARLIGFFPQPSPR